MCLMKLLQTKWRRRSVTTFRTFVHFTLSFFPVLEERRFANLPQSLSFFFSVFLLCSFFLFVFTFPSGSKTAVLKRFNFYWALEMSTMLQSLQKWHSVDAQPDHRQRVFFSRLLMMLLLVLLLPLSNSSFSFFVFTCPNAIVSRTR